MPRRKFTKELYERVLKEFRKHPDHPYTVAKLAGVDPRTAIKAYEQGWPKKGMEPIKTIFEREQQKARATIEAQQRMRRAVALQEKEDAVTHAANARAQEGQIVDISRGTALTSLANTVPLVTIAKELSEKVKDLIEELIEDYAKKDNNNQLTITSGLNMLQRIVDLQTKVNNVCHEAMKMERLHLGEPTQIAGHIITRQTEMSMHEAEIRIDSVIQALENAKRRPALTSIDGGLKEPTIGKTVNPEPTEDETKAS